MVTNMVAMVCLCVCVCFKLFWLVARPILKGIVHPKIKILSLITPPHVVPIP